LIPAWRPALQLIPAWRPALHVAQAVSLYQFACGYK
jgi:hypothetical protein